ncbi:MAG: bifunctional folylpolyglutamate synthase/dihydrofolate synthase [Planctomycetes bacterium]|nr:bifunctional folylpolyglutamate synthase/dihydrofolate synthase [Planctomycetota bacterium]
MKSEGFASYDKAMAYLFALTDYEKGFTHRPRTTPKLGLDRISRLLEFIDNPERRLRAIHIAGTKGKGSTATMVANTLARAGYKTGLFTSPHVEDVRERVQIDGEWIPEAAVQEHLNRMLPYLRRAEAREDGIYKPTFFEVFTALAFMHFEYEGVDFAAAEVGMGGRLDTTNVLSPLVCGITPVSMDHMDRLGDTLAAIAGEKAGIIKRGVPVVCGPQRPEALQVIRNTCAQRSAPLHLVGDDISVAKGDSLTVRTWAGSLADVKLAMPGNHQADNAATAVGILHVMIERGIVDLSDDQIRDGLATAFCSARVELVRRHPATVVDSSHNPASVRAMLDALKSAFAFERLICVFGVAQDKDVSGMLRLIIDEAAHIVFTRTNSPRSALPESLGASAEGLGYRDFTPEPDLKRALAIARELAGADDIICVCGSFYLAGDARKLLRETPAETTA